MSAKQRGWNFFLWTYPNHDKFLHGVPEIHPLFSDLIYTHLHSYQVQPLIRFYLLKWPHPSLFKYLMLHQWLDHLAYCFWVITLSYYIAHQVQSSQVNATVSFSVSQISLCLPHFAPRVMSLPNSFTKFVCLHPSCLLSFLWKRQES